MPFFYVMNNPALFGHYPRAKFSPDSNGGAADSLSRGIRTTDQERPSRQDRLVYTSGPTSGDLTISNLAEDGSKYTIGAPAAYSNTSQKFLVTWQTDTFGIRGRFVSADGAMLGGTMLLANVNGARDPGVAWNPGNPALAQLRADLVDLGSRCAARVRSGSDAAQRAARRTAGRPRPRRAERRAPRCRFPQPDRSDQWHAANKACSAWRSLRTTQRAAGYSSISPICRATRWSRDFCATPSINCVSVPASRFDLGLARRRAVHRTAVCEPQRRPSRIRTRRVSLHRSRRRRRGQRSFASRAESRGLT